jgi:phosphate-selective porin
MISENVGYAVMIDPAKILPNSLDKADSTKVNKSQQVDNPKTKQSDFAILQDAYITYVLDNKHTLRLQVGQTKYPLTYEGLQSSSKLNFIERAEFTRIFGDKRDLGVELIGKPNAQIEFAFMVLNGNSQNKTDINRNKDFAGRVIFKPVEGWSVGGSFYKGFSGNDGRIPQHRMGGEAVYSKEAITAVGEFIFAKDDKVFPKKLQKGAYAAFLYAWNNQWQSGLRYEYANRSFEQNSSVPQTRVTFGANYFVEKNAKVQLNYVYGKFSKHNLRATTRTILLNWQVSF